MVNYSTTLMDLTAAEARIEELETELRRTGDAWADSNERLHDRIAELEAELEQGQTIARLYIEQVDRIRELEAEVARRREWRDRWRRAYQRLYRRHAVLSNSTSE